MSTGPEDTDRPLDRTPEPSRTASDVPENGTPGADDTDRIAGTTATTRPTTGRRAAERPAAEAPAAELETPRGGKTAGMWIGLILGAIILVLLLIFVIQNNVTAAFQYFGTEFNLPLGVAMLLAAIAGALVMALVGSVRMAQMSWTIRKMRKQQEKIHRATR